MNDKCQNTNTKQIFTALLYNQPAQKFLTMLGLLLAVFFGQALMTKAAVSTVDTTADNAALPSCTGAPNDCSLRSAIVNANLNGQADTINFDATVFAAHQTINLNNGFNISATGKLTINGPAAGVTLSLANSNLAIRRVFGLFDANANLEISNLTLTGGRAPQGGAIYSEGTVTVNNSIVTGNTATEWGGGIASEGVLNLNNSTVSENLVPDAVFNGGGGIYNFEDTATLNKSTVSGNSARFGGGIVNFGTMSLTESTVSDNHATRGGGGIYFRFLGPMLTLTNSTVSGNSAQAEGGGMVNSQGSIATLTNSTISGNSATQGGGIWHFGGSITNLNNSTVSDNSASVGGGIYQTAAGGTNLKSSIIANSASGGDCVRLAGTINAEYSLIEAGLACVNGINSNNLTGDPNLGPLQNNGGATETHALLPGSRAIDKGNSFGTTTDQRGAPRPFDDPNVSNAPDGDGSDIGAFELNFRNFYSSQLLGPSQMQFFTDAAAGSDVQVSYSLNGYKGANPYSQPPTSQRIDCFTKTPIGAASPIQTYPGDPFYNPLYDFYTTIWQTPTSYAGTCRRLTLYFNDGTRQSQDFRFR